MKLVLVALLLLTGLAHAEVTLESRNGMTHLHSEGEPIARYLSENELTYSYNKFDFMFIGIVYGTQNWAQRVNREDGWWKVDKVRYEYGGEIKYEVVDGFSLYTRHTMPINRHDRSVGDGWQGTSFRWDTGIIYKRKW